MENVAIIVMLLFGIAFLGVLSHKYKFPFPIVLVLCGIVISLIPDLPVITLAPDVVFVVFLPPLLYFAAWRTSWHDFRAAIKPITYAAVGLVLFTTIIVAVVAHWLIPNMSWALAFLLGAIVAPPDAIAATAVTKNLGLSRGLLTLIEGESLVNDASALIAYRYAWAAVIAGNFIWWQAGLNFLLVAGVGIVIGLAIGFVMKFIHQKFITDPVIEVSLTFLTPYASYLLAEHFHVSGVLAVVATGLFLSFNSGQVLTHQSRLMADSMWDIVMFILNGLIFVLIGLQLRSVMDGIKDYPARELILYGLGISLIVIIVRFVWIIPPMIKNSLMGRKGNGLNTTKKENTQNLIIFGWAGMRGVVSMAAAMALPMIVSEQEAFHQRSLIIYLTFCVILTTLVLLGLTLPGLIRLLKVEPYSIVMEEYDVRTKVVSEAINYIEENLSLMPDELLHNIKSKYEVKYNRLQKTELPANYFGKGKTLATAVFNQYSQLQIELLNIERNKVQQMHRTGEASDEILRKIERELDLEEMRLRMEMYS
ncbi:Na+/H+ antiporter [Arachidicoccus ginsenosidimutans]|uniref:Na+/H+ antiporter n=1 Tax=Arachidicoccus sp. BS20 TaxID=1850526 RepID=UPI0007F07D31|nr:Na+/H+ antiporter [Arachidicoccus sp. BS20]ANI87853.1 Na+/H+ antiporter [Arachidicoccus sp. BS20]